MNLSPGGDELESKSKVESRVKKVLTSIWAWFKKRRDKSNTLKEVKDTLADMLPGIALSIALAVGIFTTVQIIDLRDDVERLSGLAAQIDSLREATTSTANATGELAKTVDSLGDSLTTLDDLLSELDKAIIEGDEEVVIKLANEVISRSRTMGDLAQQLDRQANLLSSTTEKLAELATATTLSAGQLSADIAAIGRTLEQTGLELKSVASELSAVGASLKTTQVQLEGLTERMETAEEHIQTIVTELDNTRTELVDISDRVTAAENRLTNVESQVDAAAQQLTVLSAAVEDLSNQIDQVDSRLAELETPEEKARGTILSKPIVVGQTFTSSMTTIFENTFELPLTGTWQIEAIVSGSTCYSCDNGYAVTQLSINGEVFPTGGQAYHTSGFISIPISKNLNLAEGPVTVAVQIRLSAGTGEVTSGSVTLQLET